MAGIWTKKHPLPTVRSEVYAAAANGKLYVIGGQNAERNDLYRNDEYDPATDSWRERAGMPHGMNHAAMTSLDGKIYEKPVDRREAFEMLESLSGRTHEVLTAVALKQDDWVESALSRSEVRFKTLSAREIEHYVATGESDDKAGAYAIQGRAGRFVVELRGSYSGVMGLPLYETAELLERLSQRR